MKLTDRYYWSRCRLLIVCVAFVTSAVLADDIAEPASGDLARHLLLPVFDILDCTDQGFVEAGEVDEHFPNLFGYHDNNRDFVLSKREYVTSADPMKARMDALLFERMDEDRDGRVSALEYRAEMMSIIASMDADGDGEVSMEELAPPDVTPTVGQE